MIDYKLWEEGNEEGNPCIGKRLSWNLTRELRLLIRANLEKMQLILQKENIELRESTPALKKRRTTFDGEIRYIDHLLTITFSSDYLDGNGGYEYNLAKYIVASLLLSHREQISAIDHVYEYERVDVQRLIIEIEGVLTSELFKDTKPAAIYFKMIPVKSQTNALNEVIKAITTNDEENFLPDSDFDTFPYQFRSVVEQINKSYRFKMYDCCGVMCRRLLEMLIIKLFYVDRKEKEIVADEQGNKKKLQLLIPLFIDSYKNRLGQDARRQKNLENIVRIGDNGAHCFERALGPKDVNDISLMFRNICANLVMLINESPNLETQI